jgi:thiamine pyrophosphokinase
MTVRRALVLADGGAPTRAGLDAAWPGWADGIDLVVAADGGARLAATLGLRLDAWVGDGDSLDAEELEELRRARVPITRVPADKDESDAELALLAAIRAGAGEVTILGALGGPRLDHELANLGLLAHPAAAGVAVRLLDDRARVRLVAGPGPDGGPARLDLAGRVGDHVSLVSLDNALGVTTIGLRFRLRDEALPAGPARGLSNVRDAAAAEVRVRRGRILVVEVPATLPE